MLLNRIYLLLLGVLISSTCVAQKLYTSCDDYYDGFDTHFTSIELRDESIYVNGYEKGSPLFKNTLYIILTETNINLGCNDPDYFTHWWLKDSLHINIYLYKAGAKVDTVCQDLFTTDPNFSFFNSVADNYVFPNALLADDDYRLRFEIDIFDGSRFWQHVISTDPFVVKEPVNILSPSSNDTTVDFQSTTFVWKSITSATSYRLFITESYNLVSGGSCDGQTSSTPYLLWTTGITDTSYTTNILQPNTEYICQVWSVQYGECSLSQDTFKTRPLSVPINRWEFYENVPTPYSNPKNLLNTGVPIRFKVQVHNELAQNLPTLEGTLSCNTLGVTLVDSSLNFNNLASSDTGWSTDFVEIYVPDSILAGTNLEFELAIEDQIISGGPWTSSFSFPIQPITLDNIFLDDDSNPDSNGDNDDIPEPGETVELLPTIQNQSSSTIYNVFGKLVESNNLVNVWNNVAGSSGTVYDSVGYHYLSGNQQPISPGSSSILPEFDYVFDYPSQSPLQTLNFALEMSGYINEQPGSDWDKGGILMRWGIDKSYNDFLETVGACDSFYWSITNTTYLNSGIYNHQIGDTNYLLNLTISHLSLNSYATNTVIETQCSYSNDIVLQGNSSNAAGEALYSMDNISFKKDSVFRFIGAGTYRLYALDNAGCKDSSALINIVSPPDIAVSPTITHTACGLPLGAISISTSGGTGNVYQFAWSTGDTTSAIGNLVSGIYQVTVIDSNLCESTNNYVVSDTNGPQLIATTTDASCFGSTDGTIDLTISNSSGSHTILWSDGRITEDINGLSAGDYQVTVADTNGCIAHATYAVSEPSFLVLSLTNTTAACGMSTGSAIANVLGGNGGNSFEWSSSSNLSGTETNLAAGNYTVQVQDALGCKDSSLFSISETGAPTISLNAIGTFDCGLNNGFIDVNVSGGTLPYDSILWDNIENNLDLTNAVAGDHALKIIDGNGCSAFFTSTIQSNQPERHELCLITVDSLTGNNLLVWEKPFNKGAITVFNIYREDNVQNQFNYIASVPYDSLSEYLDPGADPQIRSWKYKISVEDSCGNESEISDFHKTIHLVLSTFGGDNFLSWDRYEGAVYFSYNIWRFSDQTDWVKIDSLPGNVQSYTDLSPTGTNLNYFVEAVTENSCTSEKAKTYGTTRSNKKHSILSTAIVSDFTVNPPIITAGDSVSFMDVSSGFPNEWQWSFAGGNPTNSTLQNPMVVYSSSGAFDVKLVSKNSFTSDSIVKTGLILVNPNGINNELFSFIQIYPNPSKGTFHITIKPSKFLSLEMKVFNVFGELIQEHTLNGSKEEFVLDLSTGATGIYILNIRSGSENYYVRLVKN